MSAQRDSRNDYGEERWKACGWIQGRLIAIIYTERGDVIRIISARKATKHEEAGYFLELGF
jgi:uncharacterized DUF497 family protein